MCSGNESLSFRYNVRKMWINIVIVITVDPPDMTLGDCGCCAPAPPPLPGCSDSPGGHPWAVAPLEELQVEALGRVQYQLLVGPAWRRPPPLRARSRPRQARVEKPPSCGRQGLWPRHKS